LLRPVKIQARLWILFGKCITELAKQIVGGETVNSILAKQYLNLTLQGTAYVLPNLPNNIPACVFTKFSCITKFAKQHSRNSSSHQNYNVKDLLMLLPNNIQDLTRLSFWSKKKHPFRSAFRLVRGTNL